MADDCTPNQIDVKPASSIATLIEFSYGAPTKTVYRYARWTSDVTFKGNTFSSVPALDVRYGKQHGGTQDVPITIKMSKIEPVSFMTTAFPRVYVRVWELKPGDDTTAVLLWGGTISVVRFNAVGNPNVVEFDVAGKKAKFDVPLGIVVGYGCDATFGGPGCFKDLTPLKQHGTASAISGQKITISGFSLPSPSETYWRLGTAWFDDLAISIYQHVPGDSSFVLMRPPPLYWIGKSIELTPGCSHDIEGCRFWDNEINFGGIGGAMPDYQPNFEQGEG